MEWLWQKSSAEMICLKNFRASLGVKRPFFTRQSKSSPPDTCSSTRYLQEGTHGRQRLPEVGLKSRTQDSQLYSGTHLKLRVFFKILKSGCSSPDLRKQRQRQKKMTWKNGSTLKTVTRHDFINTVLAFQQPSNLTKGCPYMGIFVTDGDHPKHLHQQDANMPVIQHQQPG